MEPLDDDTWAVMKLRDLLERLRCRALLDLQQQFMDESQWLRR